MSSPSIGKPGTAGIITFLQRTSPTDAAGRTPVDAWHQFLQRQTGTSGTIRDLENTFLRQRLATATKPTDGTNADLWNRYLSNQFSTGDLADKYANWINHGVI